MYETVDLVEHPSYYATSSMFQAKANTTSNYFYVPEVEMVIKRWQELQYDHTALGLFQKRQLAVASEIMSVSYAFWGYGILLTLTILERNSITRMGPSQ